MIKPSDAPRKYRTVHFECRTPRLYRWLLCQLANVATATDDGFVILDEPRWAALLSAAEGKETL